MSLEDPRDEARRQFLLHGLRLGLFAAGAAALPASGQQLGAVPGPLPAGRSIYRLNGNVTVNGNAADINTRIQPGDEVRTGSSSGVVFSVDRDAYILRSNSRMQLATPSISILRLVTGALLSVFGPRREPLRMTTTTATIGIRGTGLYAEADPERSYVCTCYGLTQLQATEDPASSEAIVSEQHDAPRYILASGASGTRIQPAPFINHTDEELILIEALVGREPPFAVFGDGYGAPRGDNY